MFGELEAKVMDAVWSLDEPTVQTVCDFLGPGHNYKTVMTVLNRLVEKGALTRQRQSRAFIYRHGSKPRGISWPCLAGYHGQPGARFWQPGCRPVRRYPRGDRPGAIGGAGTARTRKTSEPAACRGSDGGEPCVRRLVRDEPFGYSQPLAPLAWQHSAVCWPGKASAWPRASGWPARALLQPLSAFCPRWV